MSPKVAVVIAAYNAEAFIKETLESVFAQTLADIEIIVVDDGSTDGTSDILRRYSDRRLTVIHQKNGGVSAARNAGLAAVRAPYVFFLDADDMLAPSALSRMASTLDQNPDRVACFGHHIKIAENGSDLTTRSYIRWKLLPADGTLRHLIAKNFICGAICIRTDAAREIGGFDSALALGEDWEFWCRLAVLGDFAAMPNDIILMYRQRFDSANYRLRKSPLRPNYHALDVIYSNPEIRRQFSFGELQRRRRLAEIDAFWAGARNEYMQGRTVGFLKYLAVGAYRYPDSILRPRLVYLFVQGLRQPHGEGRGKTRQRTLFMVTPSKEACAVENFTQKLVSALQSRYPDQGYEVLPVSSRLRDLPSIFRSVADADCIVFNLPLVSWKRMLLTPLMLLLFASISGVRVNVFLHEWSGLHWLRRIALAPIVLLSRTIIVVSPFISAQISGHWRIFGIGRKCRLVPHPPTIIRPNGRHLTERILRVREAAKNCDVVIGCFGSIYKGKAATALLDICRYLNGRGVRALIVFIGSFTRSLDHYEQEFWDKVHAAAIEDQVIVTGYIPSEVELYTLFEEIGLFLFLFPEGLTARRSSVIACLQSDRPVLVPAPQSATEFDHHEGFKALIKSGVLSFIPPGAGVQTIADQLLVVAKQKSRTTSAIDADAWWNAATAATRAALAEGIDLPLIAAAQEIGFKA
ncbi:MAG TPA: glycosyltransferase [Xanthobacteraceae bacterium]|nr:glycosyltransferase [Xanthobacteraceae bacterium]